MVKNMNSKQTKISVVLVLLLCVGASIPFVYAVENQSDWVTAPAFNAGDLTWRLADNQSTPEEGELVWAVPVTEETAPTVTASPQPFIDEATNTPTAKYEAPNYLFTGLCLVAAILLTVALALTFTYKKQFKRSSVAAAITVLLVVSVFASLPLSLADQTAKTGYKLSTPTATWDYWICNYTDSTYGVVRASDWANLMTFVGYVDGDPGSGLITPPWAGYTANSTLVYETVLGNITDGVVYGKGVAFDLALMNSIPENVKVACSYQDQYCEYINSADSSGSPYTVEVGADINVDNYIAKDSENRICFTSTDASTTIQNTANAMSPGEKMFISSGLYYPISTRIKITNSIEISGTNATVLKTADSTKITILYVENTTGVYIHDLSFDGNKDNNVNDDLLDMKQNLLTLSNTNYSTVENCVFQNSVMHALNLIASASDNLVQGNIFLHNGKSGTYTTPSGLLLFVNASHNRVVANHFDDTFKHHIYFSNFACDNIVSSNYMGTIVEPTGWGNGVIFIRGCNYNIIDSNQFVSSQGGKMNGVSIFYSTDFVENQFNVITNNNFQGTNIYRAIDIDHGNYTTVSNNNINTFTSGLSTIRLINSSYCIITGNKLIDGGTANTVTAIQLKTLSTHNTISNNIVDSILRTWQYGYTEESTADDYNILVGNSFYTVGTAGIITAGENSKVNLCWNGTTWIP